MCMPSVAFFLKKDRIFVNFVTVLFLLCVFSVPKMQSLLRLDYFAGMFGKILVTFAITRSF